MQIVASNINADSNACHSWRSWELKGIFQPSSLSTTFAVNNYAEWKLMDCSDISEAFMSVHQM